MSSLVFFFLLLLVSLLCLCSGEIKTLKVTADNRPLILFEKFGFNQRGSITVQVHYASLSAAPFPAPSLLGFFLVSDESLIHPSNPLPSFNPNPNDNNCVLFHPYVKLLFTFHDLSPPPSRSINRTFPISHPDEYSLFFANCAPERALVTMSVRTEMFNTLPDGTKDYLSVGQSLVPSIYAGFASFYIAFLFFWFYLTLCKNRLLSHRIHHLMSGLLLARCLYLICAAEDQHFIRVTGTPHGWDVLFYVFQFIKGVLLFGVIVLIGTGWSFLKPFLQDREKKVIMAVIPLQVIANIASAVVGETGPFLRDWVTWNQLFLLIDVACCCAVLFPLVWSIRSLRESSKTDGKAARTLAKLSLFRQFYLVVIGYLYFTRIVVYALRTIASYKYRWVAVAAEEVASLAFYLYMFYMFQPMERNEYFLLDEGEEELAEQALREDEFEL
ncbi:hypothetical protein LUZ63_012815 [Rhynchospora breviuscula]|uniref:Uncharacterized protein n=1 Tax=Rhynchospora breviuscula TaxID=2022672 RepID=A0A9Q0C7E3_9POAL|nr:hypothetical protein LUZ63_012815 [Rhynchospora breviuscula]